MTLEYINKCMHKHVFIEERTGQKYRFINETMNIDGIPITYYRIEKRDDQLYIHHEKPLITTNPMLMRFKENSYEIRVEIVDHLKGKLFCTLVAHQ